MAEVAWLHQTEDLSASRDLPAAAIPWPPRLGKSKLLIDTARYLYERGRIDAAVVVAPSGVHLNWTRREIPRWWGDDANVVEWRSGAASKAHQARLDGALVDPGFVWLSVNYEALPAREGAPSKLGDYLAAFGRRRTALLGLDEAHAIKNPRAKRTKALLKLAELFPYRRVMSGTLSPQSPFDLWAPYAVLDRRILGDRFVPFRLRYGVFKRVRYGAGPAFDELVEYKNLDDLQRRIAPITFPRVKEECLDLPDRIFARQYFELTDEQRRIYNALRADLIAKLESGDEVVAANPLTNLLRLQQISRGHVTLEDGTSAPIDGRYPALDALEALVAEHPGKYIVWCRFIDDVNVVEERLAKLGVVLRCDGRAPPSERPDLIRRFETDPVARGWVGTLATGGVGIDLSAADLMIFYSHGFNLVERVQGLERNFGSNQRAKRLDVVDLVAADTSDERALDAVERKENMAATLTGRGLLDLLRSGGAR